MFATELVNGTRICSEAAKNPRKDFALETGGWGEWIESGMRRKKDRKKERSMK